MSSSKNEDQEELEALGKAVRAFARFEIKALARKLIHQLQRFPASGLFEVRGFKTLWDAFCYKAQNGPFEDQIEFAWEHLLDGLLAEVSGQIPTHISPLLSYYATWELDEAVAGEWTEGIKEVIRKQLTAYARDRPLARFEK